MLRAQARARPDAGVLVERDTRCTLADLARGAARVARAIAAADVRPGDRVAVIGPNTAQWAVLAFGAWDSGAVLVGLSTRSRGFEVAELLRRTGARLLFTTERFLGISFVRLIEAVVGGPCEGRPFAGLPDLERVVLTDTAPDHPAAARSGIESYAVFTDRADRVSTAVAEGRAQAVLGQDLAEILATSGTTGAPKGVMVHHAQLLRGYWDWSAVVGLGPDDTYPVIAPFSHGFGVNAGLLAGVMRAAAVLPQPRFDAARLVGLIEHDGATVLAGPPTMFQRILDEIGAGAMGGGAGRREVRLRVGICGAAAVPPELVRRLLEDGVVRRMVNAYGLIEGTVVSMTRADDPVDVVAGTAGRPMPGVRVEVVDEGGTPLPPGRRGEVRVAGYGVMRGYWGDPRRTAEAIDDAGRLRTGDIGVLDAAGNLAIVDRAKDVFVCGGFTAYPAEIERLLVRHGGISRAAVIGVPDPLLGEVGRAYAVPRPGARPTAEEVLSWAREHMSNYKVPRRLEFVDALPTNPNGKVDKAVLRRRAAGT
ncbi:acyl-CoA synthetase (AMP-forming)/AMP-acid ligase II [Nocardiopsis mwathae]|uniref:Acyl-CoA synthetase (AMP-forming)/AMP-acid ligase II n=1 Tax=Nocardiopsis mwathae TaxID=1472723 RepID=A0A7W9YIS3_9ACTN|nr:AMP-binding protein [Nocardiopsis mwathae]MBB6172915.1 acyl-CoA synthetase (AMP-forming)/AMP-acid ligase II [Nocardiopsis mwathae]